MREDEILPEVSVTPTVMLGIVLFILIFFVVRTWILQDESDQRDERDRRHMPDNRLFPFYDGEGRWVTIERRQHPDRRQIHTFIANDRFQ